MRGCGAEPRIIRCRDHIAAIDHLPQPLHLLKHKVGQRWRTVRHDAGGRMRPGHDRPPSLGRGPGGNDDDPGNRDRLVMQPRRAIENAIGGGAVRRAPHWLLPNDAAGAANEFLLLRRVKRVLRISRAATLCKQYRRGKRREDIAGLDLHVRLNLGSDRRCSSFVATEASSPFAGGDEIKTARNPLPDCYSIVIELTRKVYEPAILAWFASPSSNHVDPRHCGSKEPRVESCSE